MFEYNTITIVITTHLKTAKMTFAMYIPPPFPLTSWLVL